MKNFVTKNWPQIFIFVLNIAIGQTIVYFINKGNSDIQFITDLITRIIDILIAVLNFIVVVYIFKNDEKERNKDKQERDDDKKQKYKLYWYQTYILPDSLKYIRNFFEILDNLIDQGLDMSEEQADKYLKYTKEHNECKMKITELLNIVSNSTYNSIINLFKDFQDEFNTNLGNHVDKENLKAITSKYKNQMMNVLYKYEMM